MGISFITSRKIVFASQAVPRRKEAVIALVPDTRPGMRWE